MYLFTLKKKDLDQAQTVAAYLDSLVTVARKMSQVYCFAAVNYGVPFVSKFAFVEH